MPDFGMRSVIEWLISHPIVLVAAFFVYIAIYLLSVFFYGTKSGRNPFIDDRRQSPQGFVHDQKARDAVIKQRYKSSKVPSNLDSVVIGSGIGGMTAAAILTRAGKRVLVLEQHDQAGGCCHSFVEKGFEFDTGIHYIGGMYEGSFNKVLLDQLTCGQLQWEQMDDAFDTVVIGPTDNPKRFSMKSGNERYFENLIEIFPSEKEAILKYRSLIEDASRSFFGLVALKVIPRFLVQILVKTGLHTLLLSAYRKGFTARTLQQVLDHLTSNKELKLVLSYICGDYGMFPDEAPFLLHALIVDHYRGGSYYPINGTSEIAYHMTQLIQRGGGRVLCQAPVSEIIVNDKGRAVGVKVENKGSTEEIFAKHVISDAGIANTFKRLLPENTARKSYIYPLLESVGASVSFMSVFIGVEGSPSELSLPSGNLWCWDADDINKTRAYLSTKKEDLEDTDIPLAYISFPSAKDPEWDKKYPGKSSIIVICFAQWSWFQEWENEKLRHRGDRYDGLKTSLGQRLWHKCIDLYPQLDGKLLYLEVGSPVSNQHYLACPVGEMYGLQHNKQRFSPDVFSKLRNDTDIPGLYLTGQDTLTCGFVAGLISGLLCSGKVLNRNVFNDFARLRKGLKRLEQQKQAVNGVKKTE